MMRILIRRFLPSMVVLLWLSLEVCSWSLKPPIPVVPPACNDRVDQAQSLLQSLTNGESRFHPGIRVVSVGGDECGIQIQSNDRFRTGEKEDVIFVDRKEFLTPQSGIESPLGQALHLYLSQADHSIQAHQEKLPHIYLAVYLAQYKHGVLEKPTGLATIKYLETLPSLSALQHLPIFWEDSMLEELQCSVLQQAVRSRREEWRQEFLLIQTAVAAVGLSRDSFFLTLEIWLWARSIVTSRSFTDSWNNNHPCLCPYVDMMNHVTSTHAQGTSDVVQCTWEIDSKGYHLRLPQWDDDRPGMRNSDPRLEISYGCHSNAHFLMNYGFSILDDEEQAVEELATLHVLLPDSMQEKDTELLWEADGLGDCHSIARNVTIGIGDAGPMESVLSLCRVASAKEQELSHMKQNFLKQDQRTDECDDGLVPQLGATLCRSPYSVSNEIRALHMLQAMTQSALGRYSTTIDEDTDLLLARHQTDQRTYKSPLARVRSLWNTILSPQNQSKPVLPIGTFTQWRNAVTVRREEKKILHHYFLLASIGLNYLEYSNEDEHFETYKGMLEASLHDREPLVIL